MHDLKQLYSWATSNHSNATSAGQMLLSLWDGERYQVNMREMLNCDDDFYHASRTLFSHLYVNKLQLHDLINAEQITELIARHDTYYSS